MARSDVVVVCEGKTIVMTKRAFRMVVQAAGQMRDDWFEYHNAWPKKERDEGYQALEDLRTFL